MKDYTWKWNKTDAWENDILGSEEECIADAIACGYKQGDEITIGEIKDGYIVNAYTTKIKRLFIEKFKEGKG